MKLQKFLREALCTHKTEPQKQLSIPPSLVALGESKALTSICFYLLRFFEKDQRKKQRYLISQSFLQLAVKSIGEKVN